MLGFINGYPSRAEIEFYKGSKGTLIIFKHENNIQEDIMINHVGNIKTMCRVLSMVIHPEWEWNSKKAARELLSYSSLKIIFKNKI